MAEQRVQGRLAAVLASDVVGDSRLMGAEEEGTAARLNALRKELLYPKIAEYSGRIVRTTGDETLIEFPELCDLGVKRGNLTKAAISLVRRAADELRGPGSFEFPRDVYSQADMHRMLTSPGSHRKE